MVVLAGYQAEMHHMLRLNPGLKGRFQEFIHFDDWTPEKCARFVETQMARAKPKEFCWQDGQDVACHQALMDGFAELSRRLEPGLYGWMVGWLVRWLVGWLVGSLWHAGAASQPAVLLFVGAVVVVVCWRGCGLLARLLFVRCGALLFVGAAIVCWYVRV